MTAPAGLPDLRGVKVLQLTQRFAPAIGGVERHVERLANELHRAGARVEVATTDLARDRPFERRTSVGEGESFPVRRHRAVRWVGLPRGLGIAAPGMFLDAWRSQPDVVHAHAFGYFPTWVGSFLRAAQRTPLVVTAHSNDGTGTGLSRLYASATSWATLRGADRVIALTPGEARRLAKWGIDPDRVRIIPNGIDLDEFPARRPEGRASRDPFILYVGRIYPEQKGLDTLIPAFAALPDAQSTELRIIGEDWGGVDLVRRLAKAHGISDRVRVLGPLARSEVLKEYATATAFVLPSHFDSSPFVLLEAMASSLPIVATRVGGVPEVVTEGVTALLVPPGDPPSLTAALDRLLSDPALAARLGKAGRSRAEEFTWPRILPQYLKMLAEVVSPH
jgi:glycosyltransferase involved in cell wall biosynthesis